MTDPRPDQVDDPPVMVISPGGSAGVFKGRLVIVQGVSAPPGSGIFVYDNTGALIGSWVGVSGTDPVDHDSVQLGLSVQNPSGTNVANLQSGSLTIQKLSGVFAPPQIQVTDFTVNSGNTGTDVTATGVLTTLVTTYDPVALNGTVEAWHSMPSIGAGWSVGGHASYTLMPDGWLGVAFKDLVPGTDTDGTAIWASGSLPTPYRVSNAHRVACYTQQQRVSGATTETAALEFETDGSIQCYGIAAASTRVDLYAVVPLNDS